MCQNESFCWAVSGTKSPSTSEIQSLRSAFLWQASMPYWKSVIMTHLPPASSTLLCTLRSLTVSCGGPVRLESGCHLWQGWWSFGGFVWAQGMQHWGHVHTTCLRTSHGQKMCSSSLALLCCCARRAQWCLWEGQLEGGVGREAGSRALQLGGNQIHFQEQVCTGCQVPTQNCCFSELVVVGCLRVGQRAKPFPIRCSTLPKLKKPGVLRHSYSGCRLTGSAVCLGSLDQLWVDGAFWGVKLSWRRSRADGHRDLRGSEAGRLLGHKRGLRMETPSAFQGHFLWSCSCQAPLLPYGSAHSVS